MHEPIDVLIPTFNSEKHLAEAISAVKECIPVNRIVAVDHCSTDKTVEILKKHAAKIISEGVSLGRARQLLIENAETDFFLMLDSDVILERGEWFEDALSILENGDSVGAVVMQPVNITVEPLRKYLAFWRRTIPALEYKWFFGTMATLFSRRCLDGIAIPDELDGTEDLYIGIFLRRAKYATRLLNISASHYHNPSPTKGSWVGASLRTLQRIVGTKVVLPILIRNCVLYPVAAFIASAFEKDPAIIMYSLSRWKNYVLGYAKGTNER